MKLFEVTTIERGFKKKFYFGFSVGLWPDVSTTSNYKTTEDMINECNSTFFNGIFTITYVFKLFICMLTFVVFTGDGILMLFVIDSP